MRKLVMVLLLATGCATEAMGPEDACSEAPAFAPAPAGSVRRLALATAGTSEAGAWAGQGGACTGFYALMDESTHRFSVPVELHPGETIIGWGFDVITNDPVQGLI